MKTTIAATQYKLSTADLEIILALARGRTLAAAGERLRIDASTVFRSLQRIERGLGRALFERSRSGYQALELALQLVTHGEELEVALDAARSLVDAAPGQVSGSVRITTTDAILHSLLVPALRQLEGEHPLLSFDLHSGNELASLTRRDADLAVRATKQPPQHLVGKLVGTIQVAVYTARQAGAPTWEHVQAGTANWVAPDDALPEHPSVLWRKRHFPSAAPRYRVSSILSVLEIVALGMAVGILPLFMAERRNDLVRLTPPLKDGETDLWLLTHPEARHLRRISVVYTHLAGALQLP